MDGQDGHQGPLLLLNSALLQREMVIVAPPRRDDGLFYFFGVCVLGITGASSGRENTRLLTVDVAQHHGLRCLPLLR